MDKLLRKDYDLAKISMQIRKTTVYTVENNDLHKCPECLNFKLISDYYPCEHVDVTLFIWIENF